MRSLWSLSLGLLLAACAGGQTARAPASLPKAEQAGAVLAPPAPASSSSCERKSPNYVAALDALNALDKTVDGLAPTDDPSDVNDQLARLTAMPCMELAADLMP